MHLIKDKNGLHREATMADLDRSDEFVQVLAFTDESEVARFVIRYLELETGVNFGDMIPLRDRNRIAAEAGFDPNVPGLISGITIEPA